MTEYVRVYQMHGKKCHFFCIIIVFTRTNDAQCNHRLPWATFSYFWHFKFLFPPYIPSFSFTSSLDHVRWPFILIFIIFLHVVRCIRIRRQHIFSALLMWLHSWRSHIAHDYIDYNYDYNVNNAE